jgi:thiol-disulfide isomerase/thioredoxin
MVKFLLSLLCYTVLVSCAPSANEKLLLGHWHAQMEVMDGKTLPLDMKVSQIDSGAYHIEFHNSDERFEVDEIQFSGDTITIQMPVFEGYIKGIFSNTNIEGHFIKESLDRHVRFQADFGKIPRFRVSQMPAVNVSGVWEMAFSENTEAAYPAQGVFAQKDEIVTGTIRTPTGDYRYLEGVVEGDSLKLSTFDGAHVFLFLGKIRKGRLDGTFYSGNHFKEPFTATRNDAFELPDEESLTYLKEGYERLEFSFPDTHGKTVSLTDPYFTNKVTIVQLMGTWCPNCLDESNFLANYVKEHPEQEIKIVALAFEYAKTEEKALTGIKRLQERLGIDYPILLAQYGTEDKKLAHKKLPMLNHVISYPTTIFIDKIGDVRKIQTGFNGPATGAKYEAYTENFERFVTGLLAE